MPLIGGKRRASGEVTTTNLPRKKSRIFTPRTPVAPSVRSTTTSPPPTPSPWTVSGLRRTASRLFQKLRGLPVTEMPETMDGASVPHHRTATPPPPAITQKIAKIRSFFSSSSQEAPPLPQRKRSVRFDGIEDTQLDGPVSDYEEYEVAQGSGESRSSRISSKLSERIALLEGKLNGNCGTSTLVHRGKLRVRPSLPQIKTNVDAVLNNTTQDGNGSPSTVSSHTPSSRNADWSPASTASTAATSFNSPGSTASRNKRQTPEDCQQQSKSISGGLDDNVLPPIEEDCGRFILIPVQEAHIDAEPSIATVESAAAAKVYLETYYNGLLLEPSSPRSLRRKKLEQAMCDHGLSHDDRTVLRQEWAGAESDHMRQMRVLKASSVTRHNIKGISIAGFDIIRILGKGSFGVVRLVTERVSNVHSGNSNENGATSTEDADSVACLSNMDGTARRNLPTGKPLSDVFAMKVIRKSEMLRACQEGHLRAERDFLVNAEGSRWVVPLIASFQDNTNLYLVMEYMIGGDFLGLLLREDVLEEDVAK